MRSSSTLSLLPVRRRAPRRPHASTVGALVLGLLAYGAPSGAAQRPPVPLTSVLPEGAAAAPSALGLVVAITLVDGGHRLLTARKELAIAGVPGVLRVLIENAALAEEAFTGEISLVNDTPAPLYGLRLDIGGASATTPPPGGTRAVPIAPVPAYFLGDLAVGARSAPVPLRLAPIAVASESEVVVILVACSGMAETGTLPLTIGADPRAIACDSRRRIVVADASPPGLVLLPLDATGAEALVKLDGEPTGLAADPRGGRLAVAQRGATTVAFYSPTGRPLGQAPSSVTVGALRYFGRDLLGAALAPASGGVVRVMGEDTGRVGPAPGEPPVPVRSFDVDASGRLWLLGGTPSALWTEERRGGRVRRVQTCAAGWLGDGGAGVACRLDPAGHVWVIEEASGGATLATELDGEGRVVRAWMLELDGTAMRVRDVAFMPRGTMLVLLAGGGGGAVRLFQPF